MSKIKMTSAAGTFYTSDKTELLAQLKSFEVKPDYEYNTRAIIVPHAGYIYSGELAYKGFQYLDKNIKNIFIIAPSHYARIDEVCVLSSYDKWATPLGEIELNQEINQELADKFGCSYFDEAFTQEHAAEVQVPFIQYFYTDVKIIPVLTGYDCEKITKIIKHYYNNPQNAFVISTDLSHFHTDKKAKEIDNISAQMIESKDISNFTSDQACGGIGVCALVNFAAENDFSLIRIGLTNSAAATHDTSRVVGYGSWLLYEGEKTAFIKKYFSQLLIESAKRSIQGLEKLSVPPVLEQEGASFITLEIDGNLRGCIGSILPDGPLIDNIIKNAKSCAYSDPRFLPLRKDEFGKISIAISLLSLPVKMNFRNEEDLLNQIVPYEDGIIINDGCHQAVYLPSVWEQLSNKTDFLNSLKQKAGLRADYFSNTFEAYRFRTEYVK